MSMKHARTPEEMLTVEQLAARWDMEVSTLYNWRSLHLGPKYVKLGKGRNGHVMYRMSDILEYEGRRTVNPKNGAERT